MKLTYFKKTRQKDDCQLLHVIKKNTVLAVLVVAVTVKAFITLKITFIITVMWPLFMRYITVNIVRRQDCSQPSSSTAVVTLMVIHHLRGETFLEPYIKHLAQVLHNMLGRYNYVSLHYCFHTKCCKFTYYITLSHRWAF